jgi:hypothetical protein
MSKSSLIALLAISMTAGIAGFQHERAVAEESCGEFGTSVIFADSPVEAAKQALKEEKLVFVLHVSGHFEESDFT